MPLFGVAVCTGPPRLPLCTLAFQTRLVLDESLLCSDATSSCNSKNIHSHKDCAARRTDRPATAWRTDGRTHRDRQTLNTNQTHTRPHKLLFIYPYKRAGSVVDLVPRPCCVQTIVSIEWNLWIVWNEKDTNSTGIWKNENVVEIVYCKYMYCKWFLT